MKKVGKTTRPFRYDLIQTPYDHTVEVMNRFKRLDLVARVSEELWTEVHKLVQEAVIKTTPKEKKCKKAKWLCKEALHIAEKRKAKGRKGKTYQTESRVPENGKKRKEVLLKPTMQRHGGEQYNGKCWRSLQEH